MLNTTRPAITFGAVDALRVHLQIREGGEHRLELAGALHDAIGMGFEELEEIALVGHEPAEHGAMLTHCAPA